MHNLPIHPSLLHPLTGEPLRAAGIVNGRIIWPIMGASEDSADANDGGSDDGDADGDKDAGDAGGDKDAGDDGDKDKDGDDAAARMLIDERNGRKTAETLLAEMTGKSKTEVRKLLRGGADKAREALIPPKGGKKADDKSEDAPDADEIRREADRAADERANARIVKAEVKALAADTFADPSDAHLYVDLTDFDVDDDGDVDEDAIKAALKDVLAKKPHLAKKGKGPKSDPSQGPRGGSKPDPGTGVNRLRAAYADSAKKK